eukprot:CAMPEP_0174261132 /NCGR_PEP_ID=MMETSP0439-20130205/11251_1 /TAXON_ID=0 /ORGANISM="Stereomyxa ramosa, Strain Chinc5" /LENGTH=497 /DNA_ID=CAMNT_0015345561 /DNA_START=151 /DNA_END=1640 /DNA_ORIENTATION=+
MWGGRFSKDVDKRLFNWTEALTTDINFVAEDIWGSMAHVSMLGKQGIVPPEKAAKILSQLLVFQDQFLNGEWKWIPEQEDVHMNVERKLIDAVGMDIGGRMHTCRSRNDQVALDSKLYARKRLLELRGRVAKAVEAFLVRADGQTETVMPGYTHVQHAQPISVAYWLSHYAAVLLRDLDRLKHAYDVTDHNPLGSGALAGTSFPIDRKVTSDLLGFQKVHEHGMDAVTSRDFMLETLAANASIGVNLSRLADEFIMWSSYEFRTLTLDDGFAMGSSMMPQKKNPGALELLRGRAGRLIGSLTAGMTMLKGLPSGYNRDFHEDKEILIEQLNLVNRAVEVIPALIETTTINSERMEELCEKNFITATELANYLVAKHNTPFRHAHDIVGSLVGKLYRKGDNFTNLEFCYQHLKEEGITAPDEEVAQVLRSKPVMLSYSSEGGTGSVPVKKILESFGKKLENHKNVLDADQKRVDTAFNACRSISAAAGSVSSKDELLA